MSRRTDELRRRKERENRQIAQSLAQILQFGLYMIVPICGMTAVGYVLDRQFGTSWIVIVCFFVGAIAGFQNVYRLAMKIGAGASPSLDSDGTDSRETEKQESDAVGAPDGDRELGDSDAGARSAPDREGDP